MRGIFGNVGRRSPAVGPAFDARIFQTSNAAQNAIDDYCIVSASPLGLAGSIPSMSFVAAEPPLGMDYQVPIVGWGGTTSPTPNPQPLIAQPRFATSFIDNLAGQP